MKKGLLVVVLLAFTLWGRSQTIPANMNLVPNSSFEFNEYYTANEDSSFSDNPFCWINAAGGGLFTNGIANATSDTICNQGAGAQRTGDVVIDLQHYVCAYVLSQSQL